MNLAQEVVKTFPKDAGGWSVLGQAHYRGGDYQRALEPLEKSIELDFGRKARSWFFLAMAHWKLDQREPARRDYDRAIEWMQTNQPPGAAFPQSQFRAEADAVMQQTKEAVRQ